MLLIWGFKVRFSNVGEGAFHCPKCGVDRTYRLREARRWFTLFFIPLIPLKRFGKVVECDTCSSRYDEPVLTLPTSAGMADSLSVILRAVAVRVVAQVTDPIARRDVADAVAANVAHAYAPEHLDADVAALADRGLDDLLAPLVETLNEHGKEALLVAVAGVARAGGADPAQVAEEVGRGLAMTPSHIRGVVATIDAETS